MSHSTLHLTLTAVLLLVVLLLVVHSPAAFAQSPYGARGEFFNSTEMNVVLAAAKKNIRAVAAQPFVAAGVSMQVCGGVWGEGGQLI